MAITGGGLRRRARRALERQLDYQRRKAETLAGREREIVPWMMHRSAEVRRRLQEIRPITPQTRVLEVGSGAHGLVFFFGTEGAVGVDPLAGHYARLFPDWQRRVATVAAAGEHLPFADGSFDVVLCDNVVDHAESPRRIVEEIARVLAPGGALYFEVNVHHPFYHYAASIHARWRELGLPVEITPFADHTVHLTPAAARRLFDGLPLRLARVTDDIDQVRRTAPVIRHPGDLLKRAFFKNARFEVLARRLADTPP